MESVEVNRNMVQAKSLAEKENFEGAIDAYLSIVEADVSNATAWYCLGVIYFKDDQLELSLEAFENSNEIHPGHEPTLANLQAVKEMMSKNQVESIEPNNDTPSVDEERIFIESFQVEELPVNVSVEGKVLTAKELSKSGKHSAAVEMWKGMIETSPNSPEIWRGLADALSSAGYSEKADKCREKADNLDLNSNAVEVEEEFTELDDHDFVVLAGEAVMEELDPSKMENSGDVNEAIRWYNMGINLTTEGNTEEALTCFDKAIGAAPKDEVEIKVKAHCGRGNALYGASSFSDSIIAYHTAIQLSPDIATGRVLYNMGSSYACLEMYEDAVKCFTQSLERGLEKEEHEICRKQISRCRLLSREQAKRRARAIR